MAQRADLSALAMHLPTFQRPPLPSNHSNSLPSTPYQHARKLNFRSRSPSPTKRSGDGSPRSTHSESETSLRTQAKGPFVAGCKFETGMAHSRRRIPYSVGGEQLERPSSMPKKYLNPTEEGKLSGDMRELYDRLLPTKDSDDRRAKFVQKLERILNEKWPGNNIKVHVFGSSGNMLCTNESDVDICITTPMKSLERVCHLAAVLAERGMERVVCVNHAKVPIVKIWDPELELACDMNVNNTLALENTRMIKTYVEIDERVRPLAMIIKYWTRQRILNDAALGGTLSSYTWICMILSFLQTRNPPVLPCLHKRPHQRTVDSEGRPAAFADDLTSLRGFGQKNKETLGELLFHFFRRYAYEIDYEKSVVSVREGQLINKEAKKWHLMQNNRLCVEEPFNIERNLGNTADDISFRGLHLEIRRAFGLISEANLAACTEHYEYPAREERVWEKPAIKPPPILTRSHSQSGRGGKGTSTNRGGRNGQSQNRTAQGRRASSAATTGRMNGIPYATRVPNHQEHPLQAHLDQLQLHERFVNEYQFLQAQEHELRMRQAQAQLHANAHAQNSAINQVVRDMNHSSGTHTPPLTAPLQNVPFFHPYGYSAVMGDPSQSVHTNPSSPHMKPVQLAGPELRRRVHRSSAADSTSSASRSHSQPARPLPLSLPVPPYPSGTAAFQQYQQARQQQLYNAIELAQRNQRYMENHNPRPIMPEHAYEEGLPKEYIGYYVHDSPPVQPYRDMPIMPQMPAYNDLQHFRTPRPDFSRLRNVPRSPSPSPSLPYRDRSHSVQSAASAPGPLILDRTPNPASSLRSTGPIIVDGSEDWESNGYMATPETDPLSRSSTMNSMNISFDEQRYQYTVPFQSAPPLRPGRVDMGVESTHRPVYNHPVPEVPRAADLMRNSRAEQQAIRSQALQTNGIRPSQPPAKNHVDLSQATNGLGIQYEAPKTNGIVANARVESTQAPSRQSKPIPAADIKAKPADQGPIDPSKAPPLLSPVREIRSPSPTAILQRRAGMSEQKKPVIPEPKKPVIFSSPLDLTIPAFSAEKHEKRKQKDALQEKVNGKHTSPPARPAEIAERAVSPTKQQPPPPQQNGWQQPVRKGKKKAKGHASQLSTDVTGEPIPADVADRKGG
ncbi:MAG: hypothetical protein Q9218_003086 [Villophora microphyllina]